MINMKHLSGLDSDCCRRRNVVWNTVITICLVTFCNTVATQKTGDLCVLRNGDVGVCQPLTQCVTGVQKAIQGEKPIVCSIKLDMPIICCGQGPRVRLQPFINEAPRNIISRQIQNPSGFSNDYHVIDTEPSEYSSVDAPIRYQRGGRDEPWWIFEKPFGPPPDNLQNQQSPNNNGNRNRYPSTGNFHDHWWYSERPFTSENSPPSTRQTPKPITESTQFPIRRPRPSTRRTPKPITESTQFTIRKPPSPDQRRVSERKCDEYSKLATSRIAALPLVPTPDPVHVDIPKCDFSSVQLIVGGEETKLKEFPHMAALGYLENGNIEWNCGGSLISEDYVLTAAHCAPRNNPPTIARLGDLNLKLSDEGAQPVNYLVEDVIRHPNYKPPAKYNDIALLKLDRRVEFNEFIRPACLYTRDTFVVNKTVATGWGKIDFAEKKSDVLLKVGLSIIDSKVCNDLYEMDGVTRELKNGILPFMMCAGELEGGKDTCQGDSGGPIQITRPNNQCVYNIIGITSFGKFCAAKNAPGVYTRVSSFVPWIETIVWPES